MFAASDMQAAAVLEAAKALNIGVSEDLSVIGFEAVENERGEVNCETIGCPIHWRGLDRPYFRHGARITA